MKFICSRYAKYANQGCLYLFINLYLNQRNLNESYGKTFKRSDSIPNRYKICQKKKRFFFLNNKICSKIIFLYSTKSKLSSNRYFLLILKRLPFN